MLNFKYKKIDFKRFVRTLRENQISKENYFQMNLTDPITTI